MISGLPRDTILQALKSALQAAVPMVGDPARPKWKVRHWRNRETTFEEMPCVAIRYVADDAPGVTTASDTILSVAEAIFELGVELVVDTEIAPESDRDTAGDPDEGLEPTGLESASEIIKQCLDVLFTPGEEPNALGGTVWDVRYDGSGDNDDVGTPDNLRLVERLTLVYRVRAEAPHVLLIGD